MKPVIKKQTHYSLLFMRDDSEARTYRVHSRWLRIFFWFLFLLVVGGAAGIYGGIHYWKKYRVLSERFETQEREVSDIRLQLERLVTLETVLSASNGTIPQSRHAEVGATVPAMRNGTASAPQANATIAVRNATLTGRAAAAVNATQAGGAGNATFVTVNATSGASVDGAGATPATRAEVRNGSYPQISSEQSPLRVAGFTCRATGQQRLRISYELATEANGEQRIVSGMARYFAVFANGTRLELSSYESDSSRFSITRMKLMQTSARLPQGYMASDVEKVDVLLELSEGKTFEERFAVDSAQ